MLGLWRSGNGWGGGAGAWGVSSLRRRMRISNQSCLNLQSLQDAPPIKVEPCAVHKVFFLTHIKGALAQVPYPLNERGERTCPFSLNLVAPLPTSHLACC